MAIMSEEKKKSILAAARECFVRFGYKKTTLEDIGNKIGLNKASLYHYFKNKEEIFTVLILNEFQEFITQLHKTIEADMKCDQKILLYFEEKLSFWNKHSLVLPQITEITPDQIQLFMTSGKDIYLQIESEEKAFIAGILENCIKRGYIRECNVKKISDYLFALADGIKASFGGSGRMLPPEEHERMMEETLDAIQIFLNGLKIVKSA